MKSDESVLVVLAPGKYQYRIRVTFSNAKNAPKSCKYIEGQIILASSTGDDWESTKTVEVGKVSAALDNQGFISQVTILLRQQLNLGDRELLP